MIPSLPADLLLPTSIVIGLASFTLAARWYVYPWLADRRIEDALKPLLLLHAFRYIGLAFLIEGVTAHALDPRFALPAAYGDLLAALLALLALAAVVHQWRVAMLLVLIFNIVGFLDLINAVFQGLRFTEDAHLGATWFIPAVIVPALLVSHVLIFKLQLRHARMHDSRIQKLLPSLFRFRAGEESGRGGVR